MIDKTLLDILWITISAFLVLFMQAGFLCLETGLTRSKNNINVAVKNSIDFSISMIFFWAVGFSIMFGEWLPGWMGPASPIDLPQETPFYSVFFLFQALFCSTAVTIVSGMVAERIRFGGYVILSLILATVIYPLFGHWAWNGIDGPGGQGWLAALGFVDWAGSTVVHSLGGWFGLALLLFIGPRKGRFAADGTVREITGSNIPMTTLGVLILWFGWIGFNGGSTLALNYTIVPVIVNTCIAPAAGGLVALFLDWKRTGIPHIMPLLNGIMAGLVSITASAHSVGAQEAIMIGGIGGALAYGADLLLLRGKIDDAIGAFPVHAVGGIWGTLSVALFGDFILLNTGLTFWPQLWAQIQGIVACWTLAFLIPHLILRILKPWIQLRVTEEEEKVGLNISEHGAKSELYDFFQVLTHQAKTGELNLRVPEDPFTEIGQIGYRYNQVMNTLEETTSKINAIVCNSTDAIITFSQNGHNLLSYNPAAAKMFGFSKDESLLPSLNELIPALNKIGQTTAKIREVIGLTVHKKKIPLEAMVVEAPCQEGQILIGTFRDITERKAAEQSLVESEERFRTVYENAALGMALINENLEIIDANPALLDMLGLTKEEAFSRDLCGITHPEDLDHIGQHLKRVLNDQEVHHITEVRCVCKSQLMIWARLAFSKFHMEQVAGPLAIVIVEDITGQKRAEKAIRLAASVFESTSEPIVILNSEGLIEQANSSACQAFGYRPNDVRGLEMHHLFSARYDSELMNKIETQLHREGGWQGELMGRRHDQTLIPLWVSISMVRDDSGRAQNRIAILSDLSEQKEREETIWKHANFDTLTNLPNRRLFQDRLDQALGQSQRSGAKIGLFFIDLDRFKLVNDTLGHQAGDELLQVISERLKAAIRACDTVARLGGDEFTIIFQNFSHNAELRKIAQNIITSIEEPIVLTSGEVSVSASIGIALFPEDAQKTQELIRCADMALYQAKDSGRNTYHFFTEALNQALLRQVTLEKKLRQAIIDEDLFMVYQPQVKTGTNIISSAEALVRWRTKTGNIISPNTFIPLAEETGLIIPLGALVIRAVCRDIRRWLDQGYNVPQVAINASAKQFHFEHALPELIAMICREESVPMALISVEITENSIMTNQQQSMAVLEELAQMGILIALDDFGTGYSSLSRLKKLPLSEVKIDRSFIVGIPEDRENTALVTAIIQMAQALDMTVIAEGVETKQQLDYLHGLGCEKIQGYLLSQPMDEKSFIQFCNHHGETIKWAS
ncbi:MAG: ammonium transporter [Magnetococcales bacterium]|nr:ammonium transporter [Magnetococcales bacterium]